MLRIAVCDDLITEAEALRAHIERYAAENVLCADITVCTTAEDILLVTEHASEYDILFLDIYMGALNGIDLAQRLRRQGVQNRVIFFSTSKEHALEAFGVNATQYLVKPIGYAIFANAMHLALAGRHERQETISLMSGNEVIKLPLDNIIYAEPQRNYQYLFLTDQRTEKTRMTCTELFELLCDRPEFVRVGASYIVNLKYVIRVSAKIIELTDNKKLPVPRGSFGALKQKYFDYYMKGATV